MWPETRCLEPEPLAWKKDRQKIGEEKVKERVLDEPDECGGGIRAEYDRIKGWFIGLHRKLNHSLQDKAEWAPKESPQAGDGDVEYQEKLRYTRERTKALRNNPRFIAAMQELMDAKELDPEEVEQVSGLFRKLEAAEFGREAMIRHHGQEFVDFLDHSDGA
jgi:hypothetical protein